MSALELYEHFTPQDILLTVGNILLDPLDISRDVSVQHEPSSSPQFLKVSFGLDLHGHVWHRPGPDENLTFMWCISSCKRINTRIWYVGLVVCHFRNPSQEFCALFSLRHIECVHCVHCAPEEPATEFWFQTIWKKKWRLSLCLWSCLYWIKPLVHWGHYCLHRLAATLEGLSLRSPHHLLPDPFNLILLTWGARGWTWTLLHAWQMLCLYAIAS